MDAVVDTNVVAYALLGAENHREPALAVLERTRVCWAPDLLRAELVNVLWQMVRQRGLLVEPALAALDDADRLVEHYVPTNQLWAHALVLSAEHNHPAYDTLFVALAIARGLPLITFDRRLRQLFPDNVMNADEYLSSLS